MTCNVPGNYTLMLSVDDGVHAITRDAVVVRVTARDAVTNVSTRVQTGAGEGVSIAGFIVVGDVEKKVVVRGLGPSLASAGVSGALADPTLELYDSAGTTVATNNNWKDTQEQAIRDTNLAPADVLEAALVTTLAPGSYTAVMRGVNGTIGIGLVEVYDLEESPQSKLGNISTRSFVGTADSVMIGGAIIAGAEAAQILFRALGPSLASAGINQPLADPELELFNAQGSRIAMNDNWKATQQLAITGTGLAPANDFESAILIDLNPGNYTAIVSGVNGATGVGSVEAYQLH